MDEPMTAAALERRVEIVNVAAGLFDEHGFHTTSMAEIARACGLRKPTLYHYFNRKHDILFQIHDELMDLLLARLHHHATAQAPAVARLRGALRDAFKTLTTHRGHVGVFSEYYRELPKEYRPAVAAKRDEYADVFDRLIGEAQAEHAMRPLDPTLTRLSVLGMISWAYQWYDPDGEWDADYVFDFMWGLVTAGFEPSPGP